MKVDTVWGCTLKDSFQKHGISRKRYAVFFAFVDTKAVLVRKIDKA